MQKEQFINLDKSVLSLLLSSSLSHYDIAVYLTICARATFKHAIYGVYKKETYQTLKNSIITQSNYNNRFNKDITQLKRSIKKLQKIELIKVLCDKSLIISLEFNKTIDDVIKSIELNIEDFNIYADRIKELEELFTKIFEIREKEELTQDEKDAADFFAKLEEFA